VREIYVSRTGDPVHAGDEALTQETPVQRGRVNRYVLSTNQSINQSNYNMPEIHVLLNLVLNTNQSINQSI
jgi:hypothetical protein